MTLYKQFILTRLKLFICAVYMLTKQNPVKKGREGGGGEEGKGGSEVAGKAPDEELYLSIATSH